MKLLGLRVVARTEGGEDWGVARVRYSIPHQNCRKYEIERPDGSAFLAEYNDCRPAPNWDDTPEKYQFIGSQFYRPQFLAGATAQDQSLFGRSHGVVIPSDLDRLRELAATVEPGWKVGYYSQGCNEFWGDLTVASVFSGGITFEKEKRDNPGGFTWPTTAEAEIGPQFGREFIVEPGKLRIVRVYPARSGKNPADSLILTFKKGKTW